MKVCQITGKTAMSGNNVSHSNKKSKRKFHVNLHKKRFYIPEEDRWVTIRVSTSGIRNINKNGISACLKEAREHGYFEG